MSAPATPARHHPEGGPIATLATAVAAAVSAVFTAALLGRWRTGRGRAHLYWGLALALFAVASLAMLVGVLAGWSEALFRAFYLGGAVLTVPWLAMGSVQINAAERTALRATGLAVLVVAAGSLALAAAAGGTPPAVFAGGAVLGLLWGGLLLLTGGEALVAGSLTLVGVFTGLATLVVLTAPLAGPIPAEGFPEGRDLLGPGARAFAFGGNTVGSVLVVVAAVATAVRRRGDRRLALGNLLIAAGVVLAGAGGVFSFLGETAGNAVGLAAGVSVMYAGFVRASGPG